MSVLPCGLNLGQARTAGSGRFSQNQRLYCIDTDVQLTTKTGLAEIKLLCF